MHTRLEVCVDSVAGLDIAAASAAERAELCSALTLGGLTPSPGLMAFAAAKDLPCFVLIRPHEGDFCSCIARLTLRPIFVPLWKPPSTWFSSVC